MVMKKKEESREKQSLRQGDGESKGGEGGRRGAEHSGYPVQ